MPRSVRALATGVTAAVLLALAGCAGGQTGDEGAPRDGGDPRDLFDQLGAASSGNYQPASSLEALIDASDTVVVARPMRIERGRTFVGSVASDRTQTVVLHMSALEILKGDPASTFYLEFIVDNADELLPSALPDQRVIFFATPARDTPLITGGAIEDPDRGLPEGATLRRLATPQGFAIETSSGGVAPILEPSDTLLAAESFDALLERVRSAIQPNAMMDSGSRTDASPELDASSELDASAETDASLETDASSSGRVLTFAEPMIFSVPINSIRYGLSGYDAELDLCVTAIWTISSTTETQFCDIVDAFGPYVWIEAGAAAGCWGYSANTELLAQRGCADFGELSDLADDQVDVELDVQSATWTGTVRFTSP